MRICAARQMRHLFLLSLLALLAVTGCATEPQGEIVTIASQGRSTSGGWVRLELNREGRESLKRGLTFVANIGPKGVRRCQPAPGAPITQHAGTAFSTALLIDYRFRNNEVAVSMDKVAVLVCDAKAGESVPLVVTIHYKPELFLGGNDEIYPVEFVARR